MRRRLYIMLSGTKCRVLNSVNVQSYYMKEEMWTLKRVSVSAREMTSQADTVPVPMRD